MLGYLSLLVVTLGVRLISAIQFTAPDAGSTLTRGSEFDLTWSSVDTDPTNFSIYLVNFVDWPPFYTPIKYDIPTSKGHAVVRVPCDVNPSSGFQFNAINGTNVYIIYAQTPKFAISGSDCVDPAGTYPTCAQAGTTQTVTSTVTVTVSGSSTLTSSSVYTLPHSTLDASATTVDLGFSTSNSIASPTGLTTTSFSTATNSGTTAGEIPGTIGWKDGYGSPIVLTSVTTTGQPMITLSPSELSDTQYDPNDVYVFQIETRTHTTCPCSS